MIEYGAQMQLNLDGAESMDGKSRSDCRPVRIVTVFFFELDVLDLIERYIQSHPSENDTWIEGMGWDQTRWRGWNTMDFPTAVRLVRV